MENTEIGDPTENNRAQPQRQRDLVLPRFRIAGAGFGGHTREPA